MGHHHTEGLPYCQNCHYPIAELDKFCPNCGQQNTDGHVSLHDLWHELTHYFTHVDNKIFTSIRDLLIPGKLTDEFFKGHRKRYVHPINLFFVVGIIVPFILGRMWKDAAQDTGLMRGLISEKNLYRNDLFFELDSIAKHDTTYANKETRMVLDTFLLRNYQRANRRGTVNDTTEFGYKAQYFEAVEKLQDAYKAVALLNDALHIDKKIIDKTLMQQRLAEYENYIPKLRYDSMMALIKFAQLQKGPIEDVKKRLQGGAWARNWTKSMALKTNAIKPLNLDSVLRYSANYNATKVKNDSLRRMIRRDSMNIGALLGNELKLDQLDVYNMTDDELIAKYHVTGWTNTFAVKEIKRFGQQSLFSMMKTYSDKSIWITIFSIVPSAWFLLLLYRRQKRLYVEHIVFLIHYSTLGFIIYSLMLIHDDWALILTILLSYISLVLAIKRFYKQSWGKTFAKTTLYYLFNGIIGSVIGLIGLLLSVLFS